MRTGHLLYVRSAAVAHTTSSSREAAVIAAIAALVVLHAYGGY
jgi:hypothetical protein